MCWLAPIGIGVFINPTYVGFGYHNDGDECEICVAAFHTVGVGVCFSNMKTVSFEDLVR